MASRRILVIVALCAVVAAGAIVGGTLLLSRGESTTVPGAVTKPRPGRPPLLLELGLRADPEAQALRRAQTLFDKDGNAAAAAAIFRRYHSLEAQLGLAMATWSGPASLGAVRQLAAAHPTSPAALLNLGWADYQAGRNADAVAAWQKVATRFPDSPYGVDAQDALHPASPVGLPPIVLPPALARQEQVASFAALRRAAASYDPKAMLLYGVALWDLKRPISAAKELAAAAKVAPHDQVAQAAAAVARFSKANPTPAFAHLGPLTAVFPHSPVVEFDLGLLLIYRGENAKAVAQLRASLADGPRSPWASDARLLLSSLARARSK